MSNNYNTLVYDILDRMYDELPGQYDSMVADGAWRFVVEKEPPEYTEMRDDRDRFEKEAKELEEEVADLKQRVADLERERDR